MSYEVRQAEETSLRRRCSWPLKHLDGQGKSTDDGQHLNRNEFVDVHGVAGDSKAENVEVNLETVKDAEVAAPDGHQPVDLSLAKQVALVATLTGASFLNVNESFLFFLSSQYSYKQ